MLALNDADEPFDTAYRVLAMAAERLVAVRGDAGRALFGEESRFSLDLSCTLWDAEALIRGAMTVEGPLPDTAKQHLINARTVIDAATSMLDGPNVSEIPMVLGHMDQSPALHARAAKPVPLPAGDAALTEDQAEGIYEAARYTVTLTHVLWELLCDVDMPDVGPNDPQSREQRQFACVKSIQHHMADIRDVIDTAALDRVGKRRKAVAA
jgi:hypothetical protein